MRLGVIADDFTGASDVGSTLANAGLNTILAFNACPSTLVDGVDACVVALKTRSIDAETAVAQSIDALDDLLKLGASQILFKYCSTFDSTPDGNIGPVALALAKRLGITGPIIFCPAFPDAGRTVYQGHLFVRDRLLSESGMEKHPINPMTDPDLRRWLAQQSGARVGHVPLSDVRRGPDAIRGRLDAEAEAGRRLILVDAVDNDDLMHMGAAIADDRLVTGGSGVAMGIAPFHLGDGRTTQNGFAPVAGPALVIAGSCSRATREQVGRYREHHPSFQINADDVMSGLLAQDDVMAFIKSHRDDAPLVYSSVEPEIVHAAQGRYGATAVASRLDRLFGDVARASVEGGVTRLVVAGGETSGAVVMALALPALSIGPPIAVGVPILRALDRPLTMALKSGNFGDADFFETAVRKMGSEDQ